MNEISSMQTFLSNNTRAGISKVNDSTPMQGSSWFESMAQSWAKALDKQANSMIQQADVMTSGKETPSEISMLTAESLRMQFLSNSSHTALSSLGSALETMARKQ